MKIAAIIALGAAALQGTSGAQTPDCAVSAAWVVGGAEPQEPMVVPRGGFPAPGFGPVIDVLLLYTPAAAARAGGVDAMESTALDWIAQTNAYAALSGVSHTLRAVGLEMVAYTEGADISVDLSRMQRRLGAFEGVEPERTRVGADIVHLISTSSGACGIAFLIGRFGPQWSQYGYAVSTVDCGPGTFAHETGHLLGCAHDRDDRTIVGAYCFSYGYRTPDLRYRDLMARFPGERAPVYSGPTAFFRGYVMGTPPTLSIPCAGDDAALTMNLTAPLAAEFRTAPLPARPPDGFAAVSPAPGAVNVAPTVTLGWRFSAGAARYEVVVSRRPDLQEPVLTATLPQGIGPLRVTPPVGALSAGARYYWRVLARNASAATPASGGTLDFRTRIPGDADGDGTVGFLDLNLVLANFFESGAPGSIPGDVNSDGVVDFTDLNIVLANYGL